MEVIKLLMDKIILQFSANNMINIFENKYFTLSLGLNFKERIKNNFNMILHISIILKALI